MNDTTTQPSLRYLPVSFFSMVMGLSGLALAWRAAGFPVVSYWLGGFSAVVMLIISAFYLLKLFRYPEAVQKEVNHPIRLNFFAAFSISLLLQSMIWHWQALWWAGTLTHMFFTLYVLSSWLHHDHYELGHANPSWFIPVVGNIIVPVLGAELGHIELSWFFFSIGVFFWIILVTIIFNRLFFHTLLPARFQPMLFILLAPPSVGFIAYLSLTGEVDLMARGLFSVALMFALLLTVGAPKFIRLPFYITSWAYSFPSAALTLACFKMANVMHSQALLNLAYLLLGGLSLLLGWLVIRTLQALRSRKLCLPEK